MIAQVNSVCVMWDCEVTRNIHVRVYIQVRVFNIQLDTIATLEIVRTSAKGDTPRRRAGNITEVLVFDGN